MNIYTAATLITLGKCSLAGTVLYFEHINNWWMVPIFFIGYDFKESTNAKYK